LSGYGVQAENFSNAAPIINACDFTTDGAGNTNGGKTTKIEQSAFTVYPSADFRTGNQPDVSAGDSVSIPHLNFDASKYIIPLHSTIAAALERSRGDFDGANTRDDIYIRGNAKVLDISAIESEFTGDEVTWHDQVTDNEISSMILAATPIPLTMIVSTVEVQDEMYLPLANTACSEFYSAELDMSSVYDLDQTYTYDEIEKLFAATTNMYTKDVSNLKIENHDEKYFAVYFEFETVLNSIDSSATASSLTDVVARKDFLVSIPTQPSTNWGIATNEVHDDNFGNVDDDDQFSLSQISSIELQSATSIGGDVKAAGVAASTFAFSLTANLGSTDAMSPNAQFPIQFKAELLTQQTFANDQFHYVEAHYLRQTWTHKELVVDPSTSTYSQSAPVSKVHYYYLRPQGYASYTPNVLNACSSTDALQLFEIDNGCCKVNTVDTMASTSSSEKSGSGLFLYSSAGSSFTPGNCEVESQFMITDFTYKPAALAADRVFPTQNFGSLSAVDIGRDWRAEVLFSDEFRQSLIEERRIQWWLAVSAGETEPTVSPALSTTFELVTTASVMYEDGVAAGDPDPNDASTSGNFDEDVATRRRQDEPVKYVTSEVSVEVAQSYSVSLSAGTRPSEFAHIGSGGSLNGSSSDADHHVVMSLTALVLVTIPLVLVA
jgi:hypothetical protein